MTIAQKLAFAMIAAAAAAAATASSALAQYSQADRISTTANPNYGRIALRGDFRPDPYVIPVQAGGRYPAQHAVRGWVAPTNCAGHISAAPDVRVDYTRGPLPLIISVDSAVDTTLVVQDDTGRVYCDDDSGRGHNPSIRLEPLARMQTFRIWVGLYHPNATAAARLHLSEVSSR